MSQREPQIAHVPLIVTGAYNLPAEKIATLLGLVAHSGDEDKNRLVSTYLNDNPPTQPITPDDVRDLTRRLIATTDLMKQFKITAYLINGDNRETPAMRRQRQEANTPYRDPDGRYNAYVDSRVDGAGYPTAFIAAPVGQKNGGAAESMTPKMNIGAIAKSSAHLMPEHRAALSVSFPSAGWPEAPIDEGARAAHHKTGAPHPPSDYFPLQDSQNIADFLRAQSEVGGLIFGAYLPRLFPDPLTSPPNVDPKKPFGDRVMRSPRAPTGTGL